MASADFTVADVLAWARTKPADEEYDYFDTCNCACGQYADFAGVDWRNGTPEEYYARWNFEHRYGPQLQARPRTFGALVKRLEALIPAEPASEWTKLDAYLTDIESVEA